MARLRCGIWVACAVTAWMGAGPAGAVTTAAIDAFDAKEVLKLEAMAAGAGDAEDRALAGAAVLELDHHDEAAIAAFEAIGHGDFSPQARTLAVWELCAIHLRRGDFAAAGVAAEEAMALDPEPIDEDTIQAVRFARALKDTGPMTREAPASGRLAIVRDRNGFLNAPVSINRQPYTAIIDTGASYSAMSEGTAAKLGLTLLPGKVRIGSATRNGVEARVAIAERFQLGDVVLHDVVFIVLPDKTFSLLGGLYKLEAVIGLPVMLALDRFAITHDARDDWLLYGDAAPSADGGARVVLAGAKSYVLTLPNGRTPPLRMVLDTGADRSWLVWQALAEHPDLATNAFKSKGVLSGVGGAEEDGDVLMLPTVNFDVGASAVPIKDIKVYSRVEKIRQGVLGLDVLRSGFVVDFTSMRLKLLP